MTNLCLSRQFYIPLAIRVHHQPLPERHEIRPCFNRNRYVRQRVQNGRFFFLLHDGKYIERISSEHFIDHISVLPRNNHILLALCVSRLEYRENRLYCQLKNRFLCGNSTRTPDAQLYLAEYGVLYGNRFKLSEDTEQLSRHTREVWTYRNLTEDLCS